MNKEEAKKRLRRAESELRQAEIVMEMHENGVRELKEDIEKLKAIINKKDDCDSPQCEKCGGRTALITGTFYYDTDAEPYENGIEEEAEVESGECWVGGYKCDDCGNVQGLWHE